ncbi:MAG: hypothetical protein MUP69_10685 [Candidatus Atribacteria bacterium]|nr:hypothetical protein [Candidatus Atribacteria bacterium]
MVLKEILEIERLKEYLDLIIKRNAEKQNLIGEKIPIFIESGQIFSGTEEDSFSASYALINPAFHIESFQGYNDEMAFYDDVKAGEKIADIKVTEQMIENNRIFWSKHPSVIKIRDIYKDTGNQTREAVYFVERVTGHTI